MPGNTKFCRGQQDYKAYSLGLFRVKCSGFFKSYTLKMSSFDKFYIPQKGRFWQATPEYVRFC